MEEQYILLKKILGKLDPSNHKINSSAMSENTVDSNNSSELIKGETKNSIYNASTATYTWGRGYRQIYL